MASGAEARDEGAGDLALSTEVLGRIGQDAAGLRTDLLDRALRAVDASGHAASALTDAGLTTGAALSTALERFEEKTDALAGDCESIDGHLSVTVSANTTLDTGLRSVLQQLHTAGDGVGIPLNPGIADL
ncbi:hypothetical protein [Streptomyces sp. RFCAC02]|uniref:hypothetical protein n=1 Tax=Streptomyces sp. RFCAC02 TaxID=2499143 RepID=UPI0010213EB1|nr:hypothetical protein [Streptomyces sp. RFCAC02]